MTKAPIDFIWSSLPVPALLINPEDIISPFSPTIMSFRSVNAGPVWHQMLEKPTHMKSMSPNGGLIGSTPACRRESFRSG